MTIQNIGIKELCTRLALNLGPYWYARKTYEKLEIQLTTARYA